MSHVHKVIWTERDELMLKNLWVLGFTYEEMGQRLPCLKGLKAPTRALHKHVEAKRQEARAQENDAELDFWTRRKNSEPKPPSPAMRKAALALSVSQKVAPKQRCTETIGAGPFCEPCGAEAVEGTARCPNHGGYDLLRVKAEPFERHDHEVAKGDRAAA